MNTRIFRLKNIAIIAGVAAASLSLIASRHAVRGGEYQPIIITTPKTYAPGDDIPVAVTTEGPATVSVYSDPPGAVTGTGNVDGTTGTVYASTSSTTSDSTVTVYAATDGETVVSTDTTPGS